MTLDEAIVFLKQGKIIAVPYCDNHENCFACNQEIHFVIPKETIDSNKWRVVGEKWHE